MNETSRHGVAAVGSPSSYHILRNGARLRKIQLVDVTRFTLAIVIAHILLVLDPAALLRDFLVPTISSLLGNVVLDLGGPDSRSAATLESTIQSSICFLWPLDLSGIVATGWASTGVHRGRCLVSLCDWRWTHCSGSLRRRKFTQPS